MLKQSLQQKLLQKLSPQQIQLMKLIQLPTTALEQRIEEELEENPVLDEGKEMDGLNDEFEENDSEIIEAEDIDIDAYLSDDEIPDYKLRSQNQSAEDKKMNLPISVSESFLQVLKKQVSLQKIENHKQEIAEYIIGNIDEDGYLRRSLEDILDDLAFHQNIITSLNELEELLKIIQQLDPPGVAGRSLQECLFLQLKRKKGTPQIELAIKIIADNFNLFTKKHYSKIIKKLDINKEKLKSAILEIEKLNPRPGGNSSQNKITEHIIPDFLIKINDNYLELTLNSKNAPELHINNSYKAMLNTFSNNKKNATKQEKESIIFIKQKMDSARWFIDAIKQRQNTLITTMQAIMNLQEEYFLTGDEQKIKPMILKDVAEKINMDISTISRVASNKYVSTPYGTILIKTLFSESMKNEKGDDVSTKEIKNILLELIKSEEKQKPLTDDKLAKLLKEKGYPIARRTIAKYREQLGLPVARLRKQL